MSTLKPLLRPVLWAEPLILLAALYFFWFPGNFPWGTAEPIDRAEWMWLLLLLIPVYTARWLLRGRPWTVTPLDAWMGALLVLGVVASTLTPEITGYTTRGIRMMARPALGMALVVYLAEAARAGRSMRVPLIVALAFALFWGVVALTASQWNDKANDLRFIIDLLPRWEPLPWRGGFNANEIAGALAWLAPVAAGLVFYPWRGRWRALNAVALLAFVALMLALILGQSRSALAGVLAGLFVIAVLVVPTGWGKAVAFAGLGAMLLLQAGLLFDVFPIQFGDDDDSASATTAPDPAPAVSISARDEDSLRQRLDMWEQVLAIVVDYPLTGVGMSNYRSGPVRRDYPVPAYNMARGEDSYDPDFRQRILPHAHNEFAQIAADFGLPGLVALLGLYVTATYMLWVCWRAGDPAARLVAITLGAGLLAHLVYGMGDAITLWDRFAFLFWGMLGLVAAQYVQVRDATRHTVESAEEAYETSPRATP